MIDPQYTQIADWLKTLIGAVVGFTAAIATDVIKTRIDERHKRKGMRRALYYELSAILGVVDAALEVPNPTDEQAEKLLKVITSIGFDAYNRAKSQPEIFYGMKEAATFEVLYLPVIAIKNHYVFPGVGQAALITARGFRRSLVEAVTTKKLDGRWFDINELRGENKTALEKQNS